jgi:hypothetical protein
MIEFDDQVGVLTREKRKELERFLIEKCHTTTRDIGWLKRIIVRSEPEADCSGYWEWSYSRTGGRPTDFETRIVLNAAFNPDGDVEDFERTLAHEYGHNWTLGHLLTSGAINDARTDRAPELYYGIRRLDDKVFQPNRRVSGWLRSDKEVLAEDYRCLLTPYREKHRMESLVGGPSTEVGEYLRSIGRPEWRCALHRARQDSFSRLSE